MVCPYIRRYTEEFDKLGSNYEVLFWNRASREISVPDNYFYFNSSCDDSAGKVKKMLDFQAFRKWVVSHLRTHKTDGIVLLSTLTGILLFDKLKKYRKKYIFP